MRHDLPVLRLFFFQPRFLRSSVVRVLSLFSIVWRLTQLQRPDSRQCARWNGPKLLQNVPLKPRVGGVHAAHTREGGEPGRTTQRKFFYNSGKGAKRTTTN